MNIWDTIYVFNQNAMPKNIRALFDEFIVEYHQNTRLETIKNLQTEELTRDDCQWWHNIWLSDYVAKWGKDSNTYIYLDEKDYQNDKWFKPQLLLNIKDLVPGNQQKFLKKNIANKENIWYRGGQTCCLFGIFYKYCVEHKRLE